MCWLCPKKNGRLQQLRKIVKGLGGSKRLTDAMIDKIQNYYGIAIRHNAGKDVKTMKEAIWGAFFMLPRRRKMSGMTIAKLVQVVGANTKSTW